MSQRQPSGQQRTPRSSGPRTGTKPITIVLLVVAMLALFAAGFGVSRFIAGRSSSATPSATAAPCVTVNVTPAAALPKPAKVKVNVYNSTSTKGLAKRTAAELKKRGFVIGTISNDPKGTVVKGVAEVRYGPDGEAGAQLLALYIPGSKLVSSDTSGAAVDVAVGPEFGSVLTDAQVKSALTSPSPSLSGPGCTSPAAEPAAS